MAQSISNPHIPPKVGHASTLETSGSELSKSELLDSKDSNKDSNLDLDVALERAVTEMAQASYQIRQLLWKLVVATFILMAIGSATRVMNAGLACPDWPLCYGSLIPTQQMNLQVFLEWIHRLDASLIGVMTMALVAFSVWKRQSLPGWLPWASVFAFCLVCVQGALGAFTVTELLRFDIVTAHLGTALFFFAVLLTMAIALIPPSSGSISPQSTFATFDRPNSFVENSFTKGSFAKTVPWLTLGVGLIIYGQSLTGGLVGSQWALHQCLAIAQLCSVMNSHLIGIIPSTIGVAAIAGWGWHQRHTSDSLIVGFSQLAGVLLVIQLLLGLATFRLHLQIEPLTIAHQMTGAALFGSLVCAAVRGLICRYHPTQRVPF